jgi:NAD(P)-dependent dehydrogenase (short-subunit alcohol dehydrogenase family)
MLPCRPSKLQNVADLASGAGAEAIPMAVDLCNPKGVANIAEQVRAVGRPVGLLVHSAALMTLSLVEDSSVEDFRQLLDVNVLAPFALTKHLLPEICANKGQIVFVNSSIVSNAAARTVSGYGDSCTCSARYGGGNGHDDPPCDQVVKRLNLYWSGSLKAQIKRFPSNAFTKISSLNNTRREIFF